MNEARFRDRGNLHQCACEPIGARHPASSALARSLGLLDVRLPSPHRPVLLHPHLGVGRAPDLAIGVERGDPDEVVLRPVVDHRQRQTLSPVDDGYGQRRIQLCEHGWRSRWRGRDVARAMG